MIRLWISRQSSLPIREQLSAQLLLGILSRKLGPGEKLPSVRELARRLKIHGNTVLAVYRDLAKRGWVRSAAGSGVFVRELKWPASDGGIDDLVRGWMEDARRLGYSLADVQAAFERQRRRTFLVVDPEPELARILAAEISAALGAEVRYAGCADWTSQEAGSTVVLAHSGQAVHVARAIGDRAFRLIHLKSMQEVVAGQTRPPFAVLIGVVSRSASLREWSGTLLSSLGFDAVSVLIRDPAEPDFAEGLSSCAVVATDVLTALELPASVRPVVIRLISDESLAELRGLVTA